MKATFIEQIAEHARTQPMKTAIIAEDGQATYAELYGYICGFTRHLLQEGMKKGDHVLCRASATIAYWVVYFATQLAEGIFIPLEKDIAAERVQELSAYLPRPFAFLSYEEDATLEGVASHFINREDVLSLAKMQDCSSEIQVEIDLKAPSVLIFTTGTTGKAKGVILSEEHPMQASLRSIRIVPYEADTIAVVPVPMSHVLGIGRSITVLLVGGTLILMNGLTNLAAFYEAFAVHHANAIIYAPSALNYLLTIAEEEFVELCQDCRFMEIAGEKMPYALQERILPLFPKTRLFIGYASTETGACCLYEFSKYGASAKRVGLPVPGIRVLTVDEDWQEVQATQENPGFLTVESSSLMLGYYQDPDSTQRVIRDGKIKMSDYGYIDEEGFVCLLGRAGDVIISGGQKINPTEVEDCALKSGLFTECVCYGQSDEIFGKVVKLLVVMKEGVAFDEFAIKKYLINTMEGFKLPKVIEEVDHVQRNKNGKIDRKFYSNQ